MSLHYQPSLLHNCPPQWLCLRFSLIVKAQLYLCVYLLHPWKPCFQIRSSLQVLGGCEPPVFNSRHCRVCICLPSHLSAKLSLNSWVGWSHGKEMGEEGERCMSTQVTEGLQRFSRLAGRFHLPFSLPSASGFSKVMVLTDSLLVRWNQTLVESEKWLIVFINVHRTFLS